MQFMPKSDCKLSTKSVKMPIGNTTIFLFFVGFVNPLIPSFKEVLGHTSVL